MNVRGGWWFRCEWWRVSDDNIMEKYLQGSGWSFQQNRVPL